MRRLRAVIERDHHYSRSKQSSLISFTSFTFYSSIASLGKSEKSSTSRPTRQEQQALLSSHYNRLRKEVATLLESEKIEPRSEEPFSKKDLGERLNSKYLTELGVDDLRLAEDSSAPASPRNTDRSDGTPQPSSSSFQFSSLRPFVSRYIQIGLLQQHNPFHLVRNVLLLLESHGTSTGTAVEEGWGQRVFSVETKATILEHAVSYWLHKQEELDQILQDRKPLIIRKDKAASERTLFSLETELLARSKEYTTQAVSLLSLLFPASAPHCGGKESENGGQESESRIVSLLSSEEPVSPPLALSLILNYAKYVSFLGDSARCLSLLQELFNALEHSTPMPPTMSLIRSLFMEKEDSATADEPTEFLPPDAISVLYEITFFALRSFKETSTLFFPSSQNASEVVVKTTLQENPFELIYVHAIRFLHLVRPYYGDEAGLQVGSSGSANVFLLDPPKTLSFLLLLSFHIQKNSNYYETVQKSLISVVTESDHHFLSSQNEAPNTTASPSNRFELSHSSSELISLIFSNLLSSFTFVSYLNEERNEGDWEAADGKRGPLNGKDRISKKNNKVSLMDDLYRILRENTTTETMNDTKNKWMIQSWLSAFTFPPAGHTNNNKATLLLNLLLDPNANAESGPSQSSSSTGYVLSEEALLVYFLTFITIGAPSDAVEEAPGAVRAYQTMLSFLSQRHGARLTHSVLESVAVLLLGEIKPSLPTPPLSSSSSEASVNSNSEVYYTAIYDVLARLSERKGNAVLVIESQEEDKTPGQRSIAKVFHSTVQKSVRRPLHKERLFFLRCLTFYSQILDIVEGIHKDAEMNHRREEKPFEESVLMEFLSDLLHDPIRDEEGRSVPGSSTVDIQSPVVLELLLSLQDTLRQKMEALAPSPTPKLQLWLDYIKCILSRITSIDRLAETVGDEATLWLTFSKPISVYHLTLHCSAEEIADHYGKRIKKYILEQCQHNKQLFLSYHDYVTLSSLETYVNTTRPSSSSSAGAAPQEMSFSEMKEKKLFSVTLQSCFTTPSPSSTVAMDKILNFSIPYFVPFFIHHSPSLHSVPRFHSGSVVPYWLQRWVLQFPFFFVQKGSEYYPSFRSRAEFPLLRRQFRVEAIMKEIVETRNGIGLSAGQQHASDATKTPARIILEEVTREEQSDADKATEGEEGTGGLEEKVNTRKKTISLAEMFVKVKE